MTEHHNTDETPLHYDTIDQWTCHLCYKAISSSRPPVFNPDNCCCAEAGSYVDGQAAQSSPYGQTYEPAPQAYHVPESNASSNLSFSCPEGPERDDPNLQVSNTFLSLGPERGLNESQHRRSSSFHANMPYQMQRFLGDPDYYYSQQVFVEEEPDQPKMRFLPQGVYLQSQSSMKQNQSSKRSKPSCKSGQSSGSGEEVFASGGADPMAKIGAWMEEEGNLYPGESYPMVMTGLTG